MMLLLKHKKEFGGYSMEGPRATAFCITKDCGTSRSFSWDMLSSLLHTEHSSGSEHPEDDTKALEARVIHNCSPEWLKVKEAAEKAKEAAVSEADEVGEVTCSELLEALELSRCLYQMKTSSMDTYLQRFLLTI